MINIVLVPVAFLNVGVALFPLRVPGPSDWPTPRRHSAFREAGSDPTDDDGHGQSRMRGDEGSQSRTTKSLRRVLSAGPKPGHGGAPGLRSAFLVDVMGLIRPKGRNAALRSPHGSGRPPACSTRLWGWWVLTSHPSNPGSTRCCPVASAATRPRRSAASTSAARVRRSCSSAARSSRFSASSFPSRSAAWWRWRATAAIAHGSGRRAGTGTGAVRGSMSVTSRSPCTGLRNAARPNGPIAAG